MTLTDDIEGVDSHVQHDQRQRGDMPGLGRRQFLIATTVMIGLTPLTGCGSEPIPRSGPIPRRTLRRIARAGDGLFSEKLTDSMTTVTQVRAEALGSWTILDVMHAGENHPLRWFVAVDAEISRVVVLSDFPERWPQILDDASVTGPDQAAQLAGVFADATRSMGKLYHRVESVEDIDFLSQPGPEEAQQIEDIRRSHRTKITPARASGVGPWMVEVWTVNNQTLNRHQLTVGRDGSVRDQVTAELEGMPTPIGI